MRLIHCGTENYALVQKHDAVNLALTRGKLSKLTNLGGIRRGLMRVGLFRPPGVLRLAAAMSEVRYHNGTYIDIRRCI